MQATRRTLLRTTGLVAGGGLLAGCQGDDGDDGSPGGATATTAEPTEDGGTGVRVEGRSHEQYGDVLTDGDGRSLYLFTQDSPGETTCYGDCADAWPPLTTDDGVDAGDGVTAELDTIEREDGSMQVTAAGWPLYYFQSDSEPGDANGQGVNDVWWLLSPAGDAIRDEESASTTAAATGPRLVVRTHEEYGEILTDEQGMTLYLFTPDPGGEPTCYEDCADAWPPLTTDDGVRTGEDVTATVDTVSRDDGSTQVRAGGWPLYYFANDESPGEANGQGVNDAWYVLAPDGTQITAGTTPPTTTPTPTPTESGGSGGDDGPY